MLELNPSIINVADMDVPPNKLLFSVTVQPKHGMILEKKDGTDSKKELLKTLKSNTLPMMQDFSMDHLKNGNYLKIKENFLNSSNSDIHKMFIVLGKYTELSIVTY